MKDNGSQSYQLWQDFAPSKFKSGYNRTDPSVTFNPKMNFTSVDPETGVMGSDTPPPSLTVIKC